MKKKAVVVKKEKTEVAPVHSFIIAKEPQGHPLAITGAFIVEINSHNDDNGNTFQKDYQFTVKDNKTKAETMHTLDDPLFQTEIGSMWLGGFIDNNLSFFNKKEQLVREEKIISFIQVCRSKAREKFTTVMQSNSPLDNKIVAIYSLRKTKAGILYDVKPKDTIDAYYGIKRFTTKSDQKLLHNFFRLNAQKNEDLKLDPNYDIIINNENWPIGAVTQATTTTTTTRDGPIGIHLPTPNPEPIPTPPVPKRKNETTTSSDLNQVLTSMGASDQELVRLLKETKGIDGVNKIVNIYEQKIIQKDRLIQICTENMNKLTKSYEVTVKTVLDMMQTTKDTFIASASNIEKMQEAIEGETQKQKKSKKSNFFEDLEKEGLLMEYEMIINTANHPK